VRIRMVFIGYVFWRYVRQPLNTPQREYPLWGVLPTSRPQRGGRVQGDQVIPPLPPSEIMNWEC
ncbi:MAG: hypothetical protein WCH98_06740, partial [Verrucomicrobiota bacterium]